MQVILSTQTKQIQEDTATVIWEYPTADKTLSGAVATISGRNPVKGFFVNGFKELAFVISGNGFIVTPKERKEIDLGDEILLDKNEKYAWEGKLTLFMATTPKFNQSQHKILLNEM